MSDDQEAKRAWQDARVVVTSASGVTAIGVGSEGFLKTFEQTLVPDSEDRFSTKKNETTSNTQKTRRDELAILVVSDIGSDQRLLQ